MSAPNPVLQYAIRGLLERLRNKVHTLKCGGRSEEPAAKALTAFADHLLERRDCVWSAETVEDAIATGESLINATHIR